MQYRYHINVTGIVQGVGFRPFLFNLCRVYSLHGWIRNASSGVELEVQGNKKDLLQFVDDIKLKAPPLAYVLEVTVHEIPLINREKQGLEIKPSHIKEGRTLVSPDVALCDACKREMDTPTDRRHDYPFINCTHCGPRFTIITNLPYDRPSTTMANFTMCPECLREYQDPNDRRFHAQPIACPICGPKISGFKKAVQLLEQHKVVAIKGVGGFHLACRADSAHAVQLLRDRKHRPIKPFAVMIPNISQVDAYAEVTEFEKQLLTSKEVPIVLVRKKLHSVLADEVAPQNGYIGIMLPYTPLHHLLMKTINQPLVMTSGNVSGDPLVIDNKEAKDQLRPFCDGFLIHNRPIHRRVDDSVVMIISHGNKQVAQPIRRSRGYAPIPVMLPASLSQSTAILAAGAELKNAPALAVDNMVFLTQHVGDLGNFKTTQQHQAVIHDFERLFSIHPDAITCDKHPGYLSSAYAHQRAETEHLPIIEAQHHYSHLAGCLAENQYEQPALGLCFDGTGYGDDHAIWGSEGMIITSQGYERSLHLEYLPLPGGDASIKHPYRTALSYIHTLLPQVSLETYFPSINTSEITSLCQMVDTKTNAPLTSSMGRLFDTVSALLGLCLHATHEAEAPIALESAALQHTSPPPEAYPYACEEGVVSLQPLLQGILQDIDARVPISTIAARFHHTVATLSVRMAIQLQEIAKANGITTSTIALSGGVWQNKLLIEATLPLLSERGFTPLIHRQIPANDGGLAYGQIAVAARQLKR